MGFQTTTTHAASPPATVGITTVNVTPPSTRDSKSTLPPKSPVTISRTMVRPNPVPNLAATQLPTPPSPVTSPKDGAADDVKERILALMVEKTGYPKDMLDVDLDLEADLGVDTVKQAEMFA